MARQGALCLAAASAASQAQAFVASPALEPRAPAAPIGAAALAHARQQSSEGAARSVYAVAAVAGSAAVAAQRRGARASRRARAGDAADAAGLPARRRALVAALGAVAAPAAVVAPEPASAEELVEVYFGCGCFWHVQHEFVEAERNILGRAENEYTSFVGYAGGKAGAKDGKVCYHNAAMQSDYGSLGHAEVVRMKVPRSKFGLIAEEYCKLFSRPIARPPPPQQTPPEAVQRRRRIVSNFGGAVPRLSLGERADQYGDRGKEYRNLVGLPGGTASPLAQELVEASKKQGDKLNFAKGKGDDPDAKGTVFIMDTGKFPFYMGEPYHQFHDGFAQGEDYPNSYNQLGVRYVNDGLITNSGCPNGAFGLGFGGL